MHIHFKGIGEGYIKCFFFIYITVQSLIRETVEFVMNQARKQNKGLQSASL